MFFRQSSHPWSDNSKLLDLDTHLHLIDKTDQLSRSPTRGTPREEVHYCQQVHYKYDCHTSRWCSNHPGLLEAYIYHHPSLIGIAPHHSAILVPPTVDCISWPHWTLYSPLSGFFIVTNSVIYIHLLLLCAWIVSLPSLVADVCHVLCWGTVLCLVLSYASRDGMASGRKCLYLMKIKCIFNK